MNKTERDELRRLIRARFKVLRSDVEQRKAELLVELDREIDARLAGEEKRWRDSMMLIDEAIREANRKVNDVYRSLIPEWQEYELVARSRHVLSPSMKKRGELRNAGQHQIDAKVKAALLELERREVELLSDLATSALESAEARQFMGRIPTVSELVPAARLREIEAQL